MEPETSRFGNISTENLPEIFQNISLQSDSNGQITNRGLQAYPVAVENENARSESPHAE